MRLSLCCAAAIAAICATAAAAAPRASSWPPPLFKQCDPRWGSNMMGVAGPGERATICKEGCAMSSVAMGLTGLGVPGLTPGIFNAWLEAHHGYTCAAGDCNNLVLGAPANLTHRVVLVGEKEKPSVEVLRAGLARGDATGLPSFLYIAHVHNRGHFVLLTAPDDSSPGSTSFRVNDPFYNTTTYDYAQIADIITYAVRPAAAGTRPHEASAAAFPPSAVIPHAAVLYKQCDPRWGNDTIVTTTVCKVGCLMSSTAMAMATRHIAIPDQPGGEMQAATPGTFNAWLRTHGGYDGDNDLLESKVPAVSPGRVGWPKDAMHTSNDLSHGDVVGYLTATPPRPVIANVMHGHHFVLVVGWDKATNATLYVNDPGFDRLSYQWSDVVGWRLWAMK